MSCVMHCASHGGTEEGNTLPFMPKHLANWENAGTQNETDVRVEVGMLASSRGVTKKKLLF